ncbi:ATP-dependent zinc metalloprotease FtsH 1 [Gemmata obscuriglobus]|uniref:ATP-binding protein n=1 Tax=Gemmata obscuriglobus TaxID=114 RepID=A0A2Z3GWF1_9BACT|nr:AAA family ATPase [Gemmata obscuriglobus]AWM36931.1 ATP-binding protein [Gemmata obscuriglobus]QEG30389.1 ATP-dependent zinc metalloprotease FtsH 1 [Gemmata obscuriglobus]VTS09713.1 atp-dependent metalloprotease : ATP-dependent metalloprotease FtsH OS=Myxococcus stipitatus (strain DSM 14675 / JCM 12634 / Mx s8) GN=MYSTI_03370 PE=4 SV=1: AAA: Peptidase_M41 [Gemmata obscuriglobus UQM 2246]
MSITVTEKDLPADLSPPQAVEAAYSQEMAEVASKLVRGLPTLIECDKELAPYLFMNVRDRLRQAKLQCIYLDGRQRDPQQGAMPMGLIGTMIGQLRDAVRGATERRVVVLPHLDLLTTSQGGLTSEAREVIPLLYENPELVWLGFKDPSFSLPKVIENLFPHWLSILGIARNRLRHLITQKESRKFGKDFSPWQLYKYVSGVNAVRLRRLLSTLEGEDYPADPKRAYAQVRQSTLSGNMEIPSVDLDKDIGGYKKVKAKLKSEILDTLSKRDRATDAEEIARLEELIPRGMIFWGPPGTGKTYFAKAIAASIGAAITIVSGPELKSKWVGESEENLRQIFHRARQSAPSIIVFDEIDSFATARGTYTGSGVEHSMVNQLLTEMDGFHKDELVFVVGTTNFVESLDPALLRPGRFEFHIHIPYPDDDDRRAIFEIYNKKMRLNFNDEALEYAITRTGNRYMTPTGTAFSGDHLNALCRSVARLRLREGITGETTPKLIEKAITEFDEKVEVHEKDLPVVATHEAGHFLVSIFCPHHQPPEKVTIQSDMPWAPFFTQFKQEKNRIGMSRNEMLDQLAVLYGGIEAERLLIGDVSTGASGMGAPGSDLSRASLIAEYMVQVCGMSNLAAPLRSFRDEKGDRAVLSGSMAEAIDRQVNTIIVEAQAKAAAILTKHKADLIKLRDELTEKKTIEGDRTKAIIEELRTKYPKDVGAPGPEVKLAGGAGTATATESANGNGTAAEKKPAKKKDGE